MQAGAPHPVGQRTGPRRRTRTGELRSPGQGPLPGDRLPLRLPVPTIQNVTFHPVNAQAGHGRTGETTNA